MIYFMQAVDGGPVKIGTTTDIGRRRAQIEAMYCRPMAVLATREGGHSEERQLHERFSHLRFGKTEQFRPSLELMEFIGKPLLASPNPDAVEVISTPKIDTSIRVDVETAEAIRKASALKGVSMGEYIKTFLLPVARRDIVAEARKIAKKADGAD